ncbi:hypothetical protein [Candidatus Poriferisodalis sp.]|uniref:AbiTii domain-containing protein n=1 Tax=Candidatus Poriferisodalis sp. TaxID=3101277 RepID=UPI003B59D72C
MTTDDELEARRQQYRDVHETLLSDDLVTALRLCIRTGNTPLRDLALKELRGYETDDELPQWRTFSIDGRLHIRWTGVGGGYMTTKTQEWPWLLLPDEWKELIPEQLPLRKPVEELIEYAKADDALQFSTSAMQVYTQEQNSKTSWGDPAIEKTFAILGAHEIRGRLGVLVTDLLEITDYLDNRISQEQGGKTGPAVDEPRTSNQVWTWIRQGVAVAGDLASLIGLALP